MDSSFNLAVHALVCLSHSGRSLSSEALAENICTNPTRVRRVQAVLKKAGIVETREGLDGGYPGNAGAVRAWLWRCFAFEASGGRTKPDSPPTPRRAQPPERPSALRWFGSMHHAETLPFRKGGYPSSPPIWCASAARQQVPKSRFQ